MNNTATASPRKRDRKEYNRAYYAMLKADPAAYERKLEKCRIYQARKREREKTMWRRFIVAIDSATVDQNNAITVYAMAKKWHVWHWIEHVWLLSGLPDEISPRTLWSEIAALPGLKTVKGIVLSVEGDSAFWGGNDPDSWLWMGKYWGHADAGSTRRESER